MASKTEIKLVIKLDGTVQLEANGFVGDACIEETKTLEKALGRVTKRNKTGAFYAAKAGTKTTTKAR